MRQEMLCCPSNGSLLQVTNNPQQWGLFLSMETTMTTEEEYLTVKQFCSNHRYPITKNLMLAAEREILTRCHNERVRIKVTHHIASGHGPTRAYPRWVLEEYFQLWVK